MKRLFILLLVLGVLALAGFLAYRYYLPKVIAKALTTSEEPAMLPPQIKEKVKKGKAKLDENMEDLPVLMKAADVGYDELVEMIDKVDVDEVKETLEALKEREWQTTDDAFDIAVEHISIEGYQLESFRAVFNANATTEKIRNVLQLSEESEILNDLGAPLLKDVARQLLESKKEEILQRMEEMEGAP